MSYTPHTETSHGLTLSIISDESPESPREWCNASLLWCWHRRYNLGDDKAERRPRDPCTTIRELRRAVGEELCAVLPLHLYDHTGITMRCAAFGDPWDSGQVGWGFVTMATARKEWPHLAKPALRKMAADCIRAEVETYDQFLTGDVYGYVIEDEDEDGDKLDSCWGFFGLDYAKQEGRAMLKDCIAKRLDEAKAARLAATKERRERRYWEARDVMTI